MSPFLQAVLDAVARAGGVTAIGDEPEAAFVLRLALDLAATPDEIVTALAGLRAAHSLIEDVLEIPGVEPLVRWRVHPQCLPATSEPSPHS